MTTCECIEHSDGGCPVTITDIVEIVVNGTETANTTTTDTGEESGTSVSGPQQENSSDDGGAVVGEASSGTTSSEVELTVAEVGADGRLLQESGEAITTDLEIYFVTDVEVRREREKTSRCLPCSTWWLLL